MSDVSERLRVIAIRRKGYEIGDQPFSANASSAILIEAAAEIERLRSWMYEALNSLGDPQDAGDHGDSKEAALRATIDEAIGKLRTGLDHQQLSQTEPK